MIVIINNTRHKIDHQGKCFFQMVDKKYLVSHLIFFHCDNFLKICRIKKLHVKHTRQQLLLQNFPHVCSLFKLSVQFLTSLRGRERYGFLGDSGILDIENYVQRLNFTVKSHQYALVMWKNDKPPKHNLFLLKSLQHSHLQKRYEE